MSQTWRPFAATNAPGTCKWCGRRLRQKYDTTWEPVEGRRPRVCNAKLGVYGTDGRCGSTELEQSAMGQWHCKEGHSIDTHRSRRVASRKPHYDKPGDYGDGHFCGMTCGYLFGRVMADQGRIFKPLIKKTS